jgi:hypothetical protein
MTAPKSDQADPTPLATASLSAANINPVTWLATDYLNHFNEAVMLLDLCTSDPNCLAELLAWQPKTYREHFSTSHFKDRHVALAAYDAADPVARDDLENLSDMMSAVLQATCVAMRAQMTPDEARALTNSVTSALKPLIARAGAVINGETADDTASGATPQAAVDTILTQR